MADSTTNIDKRIDALFEWIAETIINNAINDKENTTENEPITSRRRIADNSKYSIAVER